MPKRIFIYEPYATGHHTVFLGILLAEFAAHADWHTTLLTTEEARDHLSFTAILNEFREGLDVVVAEPISTPPLLRTLVGKYYAEQHINFKSLKREFRALQDGRRFDFALLPYLEAVGIHNLALRSVFGGAPWGAVSFGFRFHFGKSGIKAPFRRIDALQRLCFLRLLKAPSLAAVFALDPYIVRWANNPKVTYTPDPSSLPPSRDRRECRQSLGLPEDVPILLVYGAIDRRKCLDLLLPAVAAIDRKHNVTLVIAGIQDQRLRNTLLQEPAAAQLRRESRLFEFNRFLTPGEEQSLFASADIVWTYYADTYGSSGVLVKAGQYAKPAIANDAGLVGKIVSDERCGLVVSRPEPDPVARAIVELVTQPATATEMGNRAFARFSGNTPEAFAGPICAVIEAASRSIQDA